MTPLALRARNNPRKPAINGHGHAPESKTSAEQNRARIEPRSLRVGGEILWAAVGPRPTGRPAWHGLIVSDDER
jgi:hypothetical protein